MLNVHLPKKSSEQKLFDLGFSPPKLRGGGNPDFGPIMAFLERRINGVTDWYCNPAAKSEAVVCPELRKTINSELEPIIRDAERTFNLEPLGLVLRVRLTNEPGILKVRAEKIDLS